MDIASEGSNPNEITFPSKHFMPKEITQQAKFLEKYPNYDGRGIKIAIIDSGVDPSCPGLQKTTDGKPKLIECLDLTGAGDVDTSTIKKVDANGILIGLTERELKIPKTWKNPSGEWHLGTKAIYELYSTTVKDRINEPIKEEFKKKNKSATAKAMKELNEHEKKFGTKTKNIMEKEDRDEINAKLEYLKEAENIYKLEIESPTADCIVWFDGEKWKACMDTTFTGDLENVKVMSSFCENQEYGFISENCIVSYCLNIHENGNLLEICVPDGSHGTHVAHIAAGHFPDNPEKDGLAPGAQIVSLGIGDSRKSGSSQAFMRALNKCIELKVDIINLSYIVPPSMDFGKNEELIKTVIEKHGITFVAAAGNDGPGLSMAGNSRGVTHSSIIYVGAYLSSEMKESMLCHFSAQNEPVVFPFSSRGPCVDGSLGVAICAPGAAITGVPKNDLQSSGYKNGTSMSSPNAVGNIACLLSAMKAESIPISPFRIKLSLMNSAMAPEDGSHHPFSLGAGIIQICSAFDFIKSEAMKSIPTNLTDIKVEIDRTKRGIYLREPFEIDSPSEFLVYVKPTFIDYEDLETRLNFGCPIVLKLSHGSEANFVKFPKYCQIPSSAFYIFVHPTKCEVGKVHYAQIIGINPENPSLGPLFRIPITVIVPEQVTPESEYCYKKELTLEPAIPQRIFIQSPIGCKYVGIKIKSLEDQNIQDLIIQRLFLDQNIHCMKKVFKYPLYPKSFTFFHFFCPERQTIEFSIIKRWNNQNSSNIKMSIKFFGFSVFPTILTSFYASNEICITNALSETVLEPTLEFKFFCQPVSPSEITVEPMKERDIINGNSCFQLLLTYKFNVPKSAIYEFNHENTEFYDKYMDSYLLQLSTPSKKHIYTCSMNGRPKTLEKGDYIIRVQFCHFDLQMLEKFKDARLIAKQTITLDFPPSLYSDAESALKSSGKKVTTERLKSGEKATFYISEIPAFSYPSTYTPGSYFKGKLSLHPKETYKSKDFSSFNICYLVAARKDYLLDTKGRLEIEAEKANEKEKEDLKSAIRDIEISYLTKETDATKATELFEKLSSEYPTHLPIYSAEIERLSKLKDFANLKKMVEKLMEVSESKKVAEYFGVKSEFSEENLRKKEIMEKKKSAILNGLFLQANLGLDLFLKSTKKDIPEVFRNGFHPKKDSNILAAAKVESLNENEKNEVEAKKAEVKIESGNSSETILRNGNFDKTSETENTVKESEEKNDSDISDESLEKIEPIKSELKTKSESGKPKIANEKNDDEKTVSNNLETETSELTLEEIEKLFRAYMLFVDPKTENAQIIQAKYSVAHERYGIALSELKKIITEKTTSSDYISTEKAMIQLLKKLGWNHLAEEAQKALLIKHQNFCRLF